MPDLIPIRTSLEVGFSGGELPEKLRSYRGKEWRSIAATVLFPYEDAQFDVVMLDGSMVGKESIKEAHRVLRANGRCLFIVPQKTSRQGGYELGDVHALVRDGFNIIDVERPKWWRFGFAGRTLFICAQKKVWKARSNTYRPYV